MDDLPERREERDTSVATRFVKMAVTIPGIIAGLGFYALSGGITVGDVDVDIGVEFLTGIAIGNTYTLQVGGVTFRDSIGLTAYRLKGTAGTDTVKIGFPLAVGQLDSAQAALDSVSCWVEGAETECHVDVRQTDGGRWKALWPADASVRILAVQIPITAADTLLAIKLGDPGTVTARMAEASWVPTDPSSGNINAGDSIGHNPELHGYHKTIAWCTDPQVCIDTEAYGLIAPSVDSLDLLGSAALPVDTSRIRFEKYADLVFDSTQGVGVTQNTSWDVYTSINVTNTDYSGDDLSSSAGNYSLWRTSMGVNSGVGRYTQPAFYDQSWMRVTYFMMGGDQRFAARGLSGTWMAYNMYVDCGINGYSGYTCTGGTSNTTNQQFLRWNPESALEHYWFSGDSVSATMLMDGYSLDCRLNALSNDLSGEGSTRATTRCLQAMINAWLLGPTEADNIAVGFRADSALHAVLDSAANQKDGTWRYNADSNAVNCPQPDSVRVYNSFMMPMVFRALANYDRERGSVVGYPAGQPRDSLIDQLTKTATFFHPDSAEYEPVAGMEGQYRQYFNGDNCTPDLTWYNDGSGVGPPDSTRINLVNMYPSMFWWMYNETGDASWLAAGDTVFRRGTTGFASMSGSALTSLPPAVNRPKEIAEGWAWLFDMGWAYRQKGTGGS